MSEIEKVLFVVDRKDLDYQTMKEYDRFEKGSVTPNKDTSALKKQLEDKNSRIIVTTIQKLSIFISKYQKHEITKQRVVLIFDECHRSQFGDMHHAIRNAFSSYNLFGFTGTPIFAANASSGGKPLMRTTEQAFGEKLHTYTIVDAIRDKNVLPFRVDYVNTIKIPESVADKQVRSIDTEKALLAPERLRKIVAYVLEHFDQKTRRNETYSLKEKRISGFNSLFAVQSIEAAKAYYLAFKEAQSSLPADQRLKIATIFSYAPNEDDPDGLLAEEAFETEGLDRSARDFLELAIKDYNQIFSTNWDTTSREFESYYKDLAKKLKERDVDLVIVVNMFLTGFDATTLNTLWVDKNLRQHGLLQAFSRTNRILNSVKTYGNIVSFRDLEKETTDAISLFGNKEAGGIVLLKSFGEYFADYAKVVQELQEQFKPGELPIGEQAQKTYVALYNTMLKLRNVLASFDDFSEQDPISSGELQDYQSTYLRIYDQKRILQDADKESILGDVLFELELVKQIEINVDYILLLVRSLQERNMGESQDKEIRVAIERAVDSSVSLRSKKDLIQKFVDSVTLETNVESDWLKFISEQRVMELEQIIEDENLDSPLAHTLVERSLKTGELKLEGTSLTRLLPPVNRFSPSGDLGAQKQRVFDKLSKFFERFHLLG
jgi:type I restriction enzyme R subunit